MAKTTNFELVSPQRLLLSEAVEMVVIPGADGDLGVMEGHAPVLLTMRAGTICVFAQKQVTKRVFVAGGFAEVMPSRCTVLAEQAVDLETLDADALRQEIRALDEKIKRGEALDEAIPVTEAKQLAETKLHALLSPVYSSA